jgi:Cytochrome P460
MKISPFLILPLFLSGAFTSCKDQGDEVRPTRKVVSDAELFLLVTQTEPFVLYPLFPNVDSVTSGTLNGSTAHQPLVRVSMNTVAFAALHDGSLPPGEDFPDGSIVFKQIIMGGQTVLYAVIFKDKTNALSANGWLWAEYYPDGAAAFSVASRGSGCTGCHSREQGPQHDFVRTFERQH